MTSSVNTLYVAAQTIEYPSFALNNDFFSKTYLTIQINPIKSCYNESCHNESVHVINWN